MPFAKNVARAARKIVLVVEDDRDLRAIFRDSLKFAGFEVHEASDGPLALRMIEDTPPDVLVLDVGLPTLDGVSVREEIAATPRTRHMPVVIVTGQNIGHVPAFRGDCVLRKPVDPRDVVAAVRNSALDASR